MIFGKFFNKPKAETGPSEEVKKLMERGLESLEDERETLEDIIDYEHESGKDTSASQLRLLQINQAIEHLEIQAIKRAPKH